MTLNRLIRLVVSFWVLGLVGCGKRAANDQPEALNAASIPDQACVLYDETVGGPRNGLGDHEFPDGSIIPVEAFDCGTRQGKRCFYFLAIDKTKNETICQ